VRAFFAPGRVNLIGEYTDLAGGLVLPAALELGVQVEAAPAGVITLDSREFEGTARFAADGSPLNGAPHGWARYVGAVATELALIGRPDVGLEGEVSSTLPIGTGLSSSAALEVALALALTALADVTLEPMQLALAARRAEHRAVGVPCGIMDQAASVLGRAGHLLLLDTGTLEYEHVPFPEELALVIVDSGVRRQLEHSGYAERRRELDDALRGENLTPLLQRRLRHVETENERVRETVRLLRAGDLEPLGALFREAHESLRSDLEVTTPEIDRLVDAAYEHGALAARMTGGGFGGSIVALTRAATADNLARAFPGGRALVCSPSDGAREYH
jgi:galactokinase